MSKTVIDLHCDTLTVDERTDAESTNQLDNPSHMFSLSSVPEDTNWAQFIAVYIPDTLRGEQAKDYYDKHLHCFRREMEAHADKVKQCRSIDDMQEAFSRNQVAAFLSVENGSVLAGDLSRVELLARHGVCAMTLVWNGENEIASGSSTNHGLSSFGKAAVQEMERCGILVDVSHLNDVGFEELLSVAKKPFMATHSNARAVANVSRNLTDEMIREMVRRDCLIGLNYYTNFLRDDGKPAGLQDLYRHIEHFLELGAGKNLALGSDFDGADIPECLRGPRKINEAREWLVSRGLSQEQADDIFFANARRFLETNLKG